MIAGIGFAYGFTPKAAGVGLDIGYSCCGVSINIRILNWFITIMIVRGPHGG